MKLAARAHVKELKLCEAFLVPKTPANISSLLFSLLEAWSLLSPHCQNTCLNHSSYKRIKRIWGGVGLI